MLMIKVVPKAYFHFSSHWGKSLFYFPVCRCRVTVAFSCHPFLGMPLSQKAPLPSHFTTGVRCWGGAASPSPPKLFWAESGTGRVLGMAAAVKAEVDITSILLCLQLHKKNGVAELKKCILHFWPGRLDARVCLPVLCSETATSSKLHFPSISSVLNTQYQGSSTGHAEDQTAVGS